jgi:molybdenum cofactor cytidylyltransferase
MTDCRKLALVILAAGSSSRMGKPKQLLPFNGVPLLQVAVNAAVSLADSGSKHSSFEIIAFAVLGANSDQIRSEIDFGPCRQLLNDNWQSGMASSITLALTCIKKNEPDTCGVILMMADQPYVTDAVLAEIIGKVEQTGLPIVVSSYPARGSDEKIPGPPAFFAQELFPELLQLEGDAGARKVVLAHADRVAAIDFPLGAIDIDTEADYASVLQASG